MQTHGSAVQPLMIADIMEMQEEMLSFELLAQDVDTYHRQQDQYLNLKIASTHYWELRTTALALSLVLGDIHVTIEQCGLASRYDFYPWEKVNCRLKYHGVADLEQLKMLLSTVEFKLRMCYIEITRREIQASSCASPKLKAHRINPSEEPSTKRARTGKES